MALREEGTMSIMSYVRRTVLALAFTLPWLAAVPAHAQGDGPLSTCLEESGRQPAALEACLIEHQDELQEGYGLPADWAREVRASLEVHPEAWDRLEDFADRLENRRDRAEDARDRQEDRRDRGEDRLDDERDLEDLFDRREDMRDRREDQRDRREDARDRRENRWDRRH
jgi:hypothetical protein